MLPHHHRIPFYHSNWDDDIVQGDSGKDYLPWPSAVQDGSCFQRPHHVEPQKQEMRLQKNDIKPIRWGCCWVTHFLLLKNRQEYSPRPKKSIQHAIKKTKKKTLLSPLIYLSPNRKNTNSSPSGRTGEWCGNQTSHSCKGVAQSKDSASMAWCYIQVIHTDLRRCLRAHAWWKFPSPSALLMREILQTTYYLLSPSWEAVAKFFGAPFFGGILPPPDSEVHVGLIPPHPLHIWYA